ncbi:hypothetical protein H4582DRAFT_1135203 [Lactarius indigo]|nr:hypothetical protein H4582DRAFT_1135203 [Lactarius indigo]
MFWIRLFPFTAATPTSLAFSMSLTIFFNGLYSSRRNKRKQEAARRRIWAHFERYKLEEEGSEIAIPRPIGWHGESGAARWGGHLTVDFFDAEGGFVSTDHVYLTDAAYVGHIRRGPRRRVRGRQASNFRPRESRNPGAPSPPSPPLTYPSSPLHCVTVIVVIGVAPLALAECPGGGSGILMGVMVGIRWGAYLSGDVRKPYEG